MDHDRALKPALWNGFKRKCPKCGRGALLHSYLKVNETCAHCDQDLSHHRADDGPAYLTILIVGHIMAPLLHVMFVHWRPDPWVMVLTLCPATVFLCLYLLPRLKGVVVAFQWARRMHGFGQEVSGTSP